MRARYLSLLAVLVAPILILAAPPPARAVVVQGFSATGSGGVTVSAVATANAPPRRLVNSGFPASATGKVDLTLPHANGIVLTFEAPESPGATIEKRSLTLYTNGAVPGEQIPIIKGSALGSGGSSQRKVSCPYVFTVTIQVWDGSTLILSKDLPIASVATVSEGSDVTPPGTTVTCYTHHKGGGASTGSPKRLSMSEQWPAPRNVTVDGETVSGDQLVFEMESADFPDAFDGAELACAPNIGAVLNGNVQIGELSLVKDTPYISPRMAHAPVAMQIGDDMTWVADGEDGAVSYTIDGGGPGGGGGGGVVHLSAPDRRRPSITWGLDRWVLHTVPAGSPYSVEVEADVDDGSGLPPQKQTFSCGAIPGLTTLIDDIYLASVIPGDEVTIQAISLGRPVGQPQAAGLGTHVQLSAPPTGVTTSGTPFDCSIDLAFAPGTTFTVNGQAFTGNMLHMHSQGTHQRRISDVRIVHPPGSPPGTWRLTNVSTSNSPPDAETGGRDLAARGPRQTVSLDGTYSGNNKRVIVPDVPNGGMEMLLNGAPSVAFEMRPDAGDPGSDHHLLSLYECTDGTCDASRTLECTRTGGHILVHGDFQASDPTCVQVGHTIMTMASADMNGDGALDMVGVNPGADPRVVLVSYRWMTASSECMTVQFSEPVQFTSAIGIHQVTELSFWRNPNGGSLVTPRPQPERADFKMLPPGTPWTAWRTIATGPPGVLSSGEGAVREDVGTIRGGVRVTSTWATATSNVVIAGDTDGDLRVQRSWQHHRAPGLDSPVLEATTNDPACPGFVYEFKSSGLPLVWSPRSNIFLYGKGDMAGMPPGSLLNGMECESGGGLPDVLRYVAGNIGGHSLATLSLDGVDVASSLANEVEVSRRYEIILMTDIDGDGVPSIECRFPPGTTGSLPGQPPMDIDKLTYTPVAQDRWILRYRAAGMDLEQLPPGIPVDDFTLARIMAPGSNVDVPPAKPPIAGLEFRGVMPNPARGASTVRLALGRAANLRVQVIDVTGREIARLSDGTQPAGEHSFTWSGTTKGGTRVGAGLYFVRVSGEGLPTQTARMIRLD